MANTRGPLGSVAPPEPTVVGAVYNAQAPAPQDQQPCSLQCDSQGNLFVNVAVGGGGGASGPVKIQDAGGVNLATVKAANTAATSADTALVVTTNGSITAGACANTAVTSTSSTVLAANTARRECIFINTDVVTVYIGLGQTPTATAYHIVLKPCAVAHDGTGGSFVSDTWKGAVNAIVASTTGHIAVTELT